MLLLIGIGLAIFVVPAPWNIPIVILFGLLEIAETSWAWRRARRGGEPGPKALIGATGRAVTDCRPDGTVRVHARIMQAQCAVGVDSGKRIRVIGRDEETQMLFVEPLE